MKSKGRYPTWFVLAKGVIGSVGLVTLGLLTNTLSEEYAVWYMEWLAPMALFSLCTIVAHSVGKLSVMLIGYIGSRRKV